MDGEGPGSTRCTGELEAMGSRDVALSGAFSSLQQQAHKRQPWVVLLSCYGSLRGESLRRTAGRGSATVPCLQGRQAFLQRHSLLQMSFLPSPRTIPPQSTAVLTPGPLSTPHAPARALACTGGHASRAGYTACGRWPCGSLCRLPQISCFTL